VTTLQPHSTSHVRPSAAAAMLAVNRDQLRKLVGTGLIRVAATTRGGYRRFNVADVLTLAAWPQLPIPAAGVIALHVGPLQHVPNGAAHQQTWIGWSATASDRGLSQAQLDDAWRGWWVCAADYAVAVADVGGFIVAARRIAGYTRAGNRLRFDFSPPDPELEDRFVGRRIRSAPGPRVQPLCATRAQPG